MKANTNRFSFTQGMCVHCLGIGGIGLSALAQWLTALGAVVSGTDRTESSVTALLRERGIAVATEEENDVLPEQIDAVFFSDDIPENHPLRMEAQKRNIPQWSYAEALGALTEAYRTVAIAGTHGKSTTTALVARILEAAGVDPTVVVGTRVPDYGNTNFRSGKSNVMVVEADEYRNHFLHLRPAISAILNIDYDHVDAFPTEESYGDAFRHFVRVTDSAGEVVVRPDDLPQVQHDLGSRTVKTFAVGEHARDANFSVRSFVTRDGHLFFDVCRDNAHFVSVEMEMTGDHIVWDSLAAIAATSRWNIPAETIAAALRSFRGTWRRFEILGEFRGASVISDYGHHPAELSAVLNAARQKYPHRRLVFVFQPHHRARTRAFEQKFLDVLHRVDVVILLEVFDVAGREKTAPISTRSWVDTLQADHVDAVYAASLDDARAEIEKTVKPSDVLLCVGAGNIDLLARSLVAA